MSERSDCRKCALAKLSQAARRYDVHCHMEQVFEIGLEQDQVKRRTALLEIHEKVDVALLAIVASYYRAEYADI